MRAHKVWLTSGVSRLALHAGSPPDVMQFYRAAMIAGQRLGLIASRPKRTAA